jgi:glyoxylase-like metal-dependent hydrolase (beta-lactamase superfamily II)
VALAEPSRLTQPLPGGREGATVVLHPMVCAYMDSPPEFMAMKGSRLATMRKGLGSRKGWTRLPIVAFLVEHPGVGPIIVDTGFHPSVAVDPKQNLGSVYGRIYSIDMRPEQAIPAQLRERKGIDPGDVRVAIMTHLHMDHASAISEFTSATFVLGLGEWRAFHSSRFALNGYVRSHVQHAVEYKEIPFDSPVIDSYGTFGQSFDLFGDGSVRLVYTPGHTHGHQSVILRLKQREALVTGDAIYFLRTLDDERRGYAMADEHKWRRSIAEIRLYRRENPDALIIPGHDPEEWEKLEERYE